MIRGGASIIGLLQASDFHKAAHVDNLWLRIEFDVLNMAGHVINHLEDVNHVPNSQNKFGDIREVEK